MKKGGREKKKKAGWILTPILTSKMIPQIRNPNWEDLLPRDRAEGLHTR